MVQNNENNEERGFLSRMRNMFRNIEPKDRIFTAEEAYFKAKYGVYQPTEKRIKDNQRSIREMIQSRLSPMYKGETKFRTYSCVVDLADDMLPYEEQVFKPFVEGGFKITNISDKIEEFGDSHVYLISWNRDDNKLSSK